MANPKLEVLRRAVVEAGKRLVKTRRAWSVFHLRPPRKLTFEAMEKRLNAAIRAHDLAVDALIAREAARR